MSDTLIDDGIRVSVNGSLLKPGQAMRLTPKHKSILALKAAGLDQREIAGIMQVTEVTVSKVCTHPDAQELLNQLTTDHILGVMQDVNLLIQGSAREAFGTIVDLMRNCPKPEVRRDCAFDLLDRAGFTAKVNNTPPPVNFGDEGANRIVEALWNSKREVAVPKPATGGDLEPQTKDADWEIAE